MASPRSEANGQGGKAGVMSLKNVRDDARYRWRDRRAKKTFDDLASQISLIWKEAASGARGREAEEVDLIRREAHRLAQPLTQQAAKLRTMYARPVKTTAIEGQEPQAGSEIALEIDGLDREPAANAGLATSAD